MFEGIEIHSTSPRPLGIPRLGALLTPLRCLPIERRSSRRSPLAGSRRRRRGTTETVSPCVSTRRRDREPVGLEKCGRCVRDGTPRSPRAALRLLATDHSGRAGALRTARARSGQALAPAGQSGGLRCVAAHPPASPLGSGHVVSAPALHPSGSCGPRLRRPRRTWLRRGERGMRWTLAPGGSARGAGWVPS